MSQKGKKQSVAELLKAWLRGDLQSRQEHDLYQATEDDPFLRDALQGYESFPEGQHSKRIDNIKNQLHQKKERRIILPIRIAAAAASILIVTMSVLWLTQSPQADLADMPNVEPATEKGTPVDDAIIPANMESADVADQEVRRRKDPKGSCSQKTSRSH